MSTTMACSAVLKQHLLGLDVELVRIDSRQNTKVPVEHPILELMGARANLQMFSGLRRAAAVCVYMYKVFRVYLHGKRYREI